MRPLVLYAGWVVAAFFLGVGVGGYAFAPVLVASWKAAEAKQASSAPSGVGTPRLSLVPFPAPAATPTPAATSKPGAQVAASTQEPPLSASDLPNVAFDRLPPNKRTLAVRLLNEIRQPCGCGQSIARCAKADLQCPSIQRTVEALMEAIHQGRRRDEILADVEAASKSSEAATDGEAQTPKAGTIYHVPLGQAPTQGPAHAPLTVVVFSDFECNYCAQASAQIQTVVQAYGQDKVRIAFRHLPLPFHPNALAAAIASLAAHRQGKFWPYHALLFQHQDKLTSADLLRYAHDLKLDIPAFQKDILDPALQQQVQADMKLASELGVPGTPSFFVNGYALGENESLLDAAKRAFAKAEELRKRGVSPESLYAEIIKNGRTKP